MSFNEKKRNEFLDIPYAEHIIPFPNFASVIMQHAREFPDKIALGFNSKSYTYSELLQTCFELELKTDITLSMKDTENDLILLLALLLQGIPFNLDFEANTTLKLNEIKRQKKDIHYFEPPYVRLDDKAMTLNKEFCFSQYNILVAAQAVGNAFKLFRPGNALCPLSITSIADVSFGVLAPLYFAKSIYFEQNDDKNYFQYSWNIQIESNLRDASTILFTAKTDVKAYTLEKSFDEILGLGPVISPKGEMVKLLGLDIEEVKGEWKVSGHCLGEKLT
jgi:hypothetical protein